MEAAEKGFGRMVRSSATQIERVYSAILSGYRTVREVQIGTGLQSNHCSAYLARLRTAGQIKATGYVRYPAEKQWMTFYEPMSGPCAPRGTAARIQPKD